MFLGFGEIAALQRPQTFGIEMADFSVSSLVWVSAAERGEEKKACLKGKVGGVTSVVIGGCTFEK